MATFVLINTLQYGNSGTLKSGSLVNDVCEDATAIAAAGGLLAASSAIMLAAATVVQGWWRDGKSREECDAAMLAVYQVSHDSVDSHTTGLTVNNATTGATASAGVTGATVSGNYVESCASWSKSLLAPAVAVHAQNVGGGVLNLVAGFTNHLPRRTLAITRSAHGPANVTYTCYYTAPGGLSTTTQVVVPSGGTGTTLVAGEWTRVTTTVDPDSTSDFATGAGFSVGEVIQAASTPVLSCNGAIDAIASSDLTTGTITPSTAPDGAKEFCVWYKSTHAHSLVEGAGHGHALTDAGHVHAVTDAGHTHALS